MHEREWEMMYPSRLFRVDHLPVNDMIKSGFILQPTVVGMSIRNEARLLANSCNFFRLRMRIINRSKYVLTINGFVRTHKTQQHPLPKKFRNKKRG
jgi:hypothetical protein